MSATKLTINSGNSLSVAIGTLRKMYKDHKYFQIGIDTGKKRSINVNFVQHGWYKQIAAEEQEYTTDMVKCLCKYNLGLPLLRASDEGFNEVCEKVIDPLPYELKIEAMRILPVTSLFKSPQATEYMKAMQAHYLNRVDLQYPQNT